MNASGLYKAAITVAAGLALLLIPFRAVSVARASNYITFRDMAGNWAESAVQQAVEAGYVNGYPDGTFRPGAPVTRAELLKMMTVAGKLPPAAQAPFRFNDTANHWVERDGYLAQASTFGLIVRSDYSDGFGPDVSATRLYTTIMALRLLGAEGQVAALADTRPDFADASRLPAYAVGWVRLAVRDGIMHGYPDGTFRPDQPVTRAEAVAIVQRTLTIMTKGTDPNLGPGANGQAVTPAVPPVVPATDSRPTADVVPAGPVDVRVDWLTPSNDATPRMHPVRSVSMVDGSIGYGLGLPQDGDALLATRDGGATWEQIGSLPDDGQPWHNDFGWEAGSVSFLNAKVGWAVNVSGGLLTTRDGGKQWQPVSLPAGTTAVLVRFAAEQKGCVQVVDPEMKALLKTVDGGATWEKLWGPSGLVGCARELAGVFSAKVDYDDFVLTEARPDGFVWITWAHGMGEHSLISVDDGQHWQMYNWPPYPGFRQISFGTKEVGVALLRDGRLLRTQDGGATWQEV